MLNETGQGFEFLLAEDVGCHVLIGLSAVVRQEQISAALIKAQGQYVAAPAGVVLQRDAFEARQLSRAFFVIKVLGIESLTGADIELVALNVQPGLRVRAHPLASVGVKAEGAEQLCRRGERLCDGKKNGQDGMLHHH